MGKGNHALAKVVKISFIQILKLYIKFNLFIFTKDLFEKLIYITAIIYKSTIFVYHIISFGSVFSYVPKNL